MAEEITTFVGHMSDIKPSVCTWFSRRTPAHRQLLWFHYKASVFCLGPESLSHFMCVVRADNCDTWECLLCLLFDQLWQSKRELKKQNIETNIHDRHTASALTTRCSSSADVSSARVSTGGL